MYEGCGTLMCELLQFCGGGSAPAKSFLIDPKATVHSPVGDGAGVVSPVGKRWEMFHNPSHREVGGSRVSKSRI